MAANQWRKRITKLQDDMAELTTRLRVQKLLGGVEGEAGPKGPEGLRGQRGDDGFGGEAGSDGDRGDQGDRGVEQSGPEGPPGEEGKSGPEGSQGPEGKKGDAGETGQPGVDGAAGDVQDLHSKWTNSLVAPSASQVSRSNKVLSVNLCAGLVGVTGVSVSVTGLSVCCAFLNQSVYALSGALYGQTNDTAAGKHVTSAGVVSAILTPVLAVPAASLVSLVAKKIFGSRNENRAFANKSPANTKIKL